MKLPFPRTLASQLVAILICVLIISQFITLLVVIGERRLTARMTETGAAMSQFVEEARTLQLEPNTRLPHLIYQGGEHLTVLRVARVSQVERTEDARIDRAASDQLRRQLEAAGMKPISVQVARRQLDRRSPPPLPPRPEADASTTTLSKIVLTPEPPRYRPPPPPPRRDGERKRDRRDAPPIEYERPFQDVAPIYPDPSPTPSAVPNELTTRETTPQESDPETERPIPAEGDIRPLPPPRQPGPPPPGLEEVILSAQLEPGIWLNARKTYYSAIAVSYRIALFTGAIALVSSILVWLFARRVARPLKHLAVSADRLGRGRSSDKVEEQGPVDVRTAAQAFNQMQDRLTKLLETQRTMLRAVGHDLRTPLTSLRIRADSIPEEHGREQILGTLKDMQEMTEEILRWARESSVLEPVSPVDIGTLLESLVDDYADRGEPVSYVGTHSPVISEIRRVALRRAVQNLIDNALKYGHTARISLSTKTDQVVIQVADEGPGIPTDKLEDITKPFVRLEGSRSKDTGGLGLGLAIVQSVVLAHGGELVFENLEGGGLSASIHLPHIT